MTTDEIPTSPSVQADCGYQMSGTSPILHLPRGLARNGVRYSDGVPYYCYVPSRIDPAARPLISVHGISRRASSHIKAFAPWAERTGRVLIAPLFAQSYCRRYQKVVVDKRRADWALLAVLRDIEGAKGLTIDRFDLFGFSGGAQFGHRLALLYPERIGRLAIASAGWYTLPDREEVFPYGLAPYKSKKRRAQPDLEACLRIPTLVLVGEGDVLRDPGLRKDPAIDQHQGLTRVERASRWTMAMRKAAMDRGIRSDFEFQLVPGCGHSFECCVRDGGMASLVTDWLDRP